MSAARDPQFQKVSANGLEFAYLSWGASSGPLALLVHGFPDSPHTWRHLGPQLAADGYHVVAPWTRGFAPTEVPPDRVFTLQQLSDDLNVLRETLGDDRDAVLVGHDWGAIAGYRAVGAAHGRWRAMVGMSVAPEPVLARSALSLSQLRKSTYIVTFQVPGAERLLRRGNGKLVRRLWHEWSPGYEATDVDLDVVIEATSTPEGARAALAYYRGLGQAIALGKAYRRDSPMPYRPTLFLQGSADGALAVIDPDEVTGVLADGRAEVFEGLGHFLHLEDPARVNKRIRTFLGG